MTGPRQVCHLCQRERPAAQLVRTQVSGEEPLWWCPSDPDPNRDTCLQIAQRRLGAYPSRRRSEVESEAEDARPLCGSCDSLPAVRDGLCGYCWLTRWKAEDALQREEPSAA